MNNIDKLAETAQKFNIPAEPLPQLVLPIQNTRECRQVKIIEQAKKFDLPMIAPQAFQRSYWDKALGFRLPVFGLFDVTFNPEIKMQYTLKNGECIDGTQRNNGLGFNPGTTDIERTVYRKTLAYRIPIAAVILVVWFYAFYPLFQLYTLPSSNALQVENDRATGAIGMIFTSFVMLVTISMALWKRSEGTTKICFTAELRNLIPQKVVDLIQKHQKENTFHRMYIVADLQGQWKMKNVFTPAPDPDPLLVGESIIDGKSTFFLICRYDMTEAESYVSKEFLVS